MDSGAVVHRGGRMWLAPPPMIRASRDRGFARGGARFFSKGSRHTCWYNVISNGMANTQADVTRLLVEWSQGDQRALEQLTPMVYSELRRLADRYLRRERPGHTLQSTALVHEA